MDKRTSAVSYDFGPGWNREAFAEDRLAELQAKYEREAAPLQKMLAEERASKRPVFIPLP